MKQSLVRVQWRVSGVIEAEVEEVWNVLLETHPNLLANDKTAIRNGSEVFKTSRGTSGEGKIYLEVDASQYSISVKGEWWYRGVHTLGEHPQGTLLTYSVHNVAPMLSRWMASLVQGPEHARTMKSRLESMLNAIGERLDCKTYLVQS
jgi:predicted heme/steroid binding protein